LRINDEEEERKIEYNREGDKENNKEINDTAFSFK
jgi:hypothetical protein